MSYFDNELKKIISKYNKNENSELEFHFKFLNIEKLLFEKIFTQLKKDKNSYSIEQQVNIVYTDPNNIYNNYRVTKQFQDGKNLNDDIIVLKKSINKPLNIKSNIENILNISLHINEEKRINDIPLSYKIKYIYIKLRISFITKYSQNMRYDLDLTKEINIDDNNLKEYKNNILFPINIDNYLKKVPYNHIDRISLEIEVLKNEEINNINIMEPIEYLYEIVTPDYKNKVNYQQFIYKIATYLINNKYLLNQFKTKSGFKRLSNNVVELNHNLYYNTVLPNIEYYYLTDKIDGQRCMLYITKNEIKLISDNLYIINIENVSLVKDGEIIILDSEFIYNGEIKDNILNISNLEVFVFDIITIDNKNVSDEPFEERIKYFDKVNDILKKNELGVVKKFVKLTKENYKKEIEQYYEKSKEQKYDIDGLIFTPTSEITDSKGLNKKYINMVAYKWKPEEHITIDFYIAKEKQNKYILCSGINKESFDKLNIQLIDKYNKYIPKKYHYKKYFPIPFAPSLNPLIYSYTHTSNKDLTGKIGEFLFNIKKQEWKLIRIRTDRDIEVERGEYFGNNFKYAEYNWHNLHNPLKISDLTSKKSDDYFVVNSDEKYKAQTNFNSFVKTIILESVINHNLSDKNNTDWIIDLASGKGQDLARINDLGFNNGLFIDIDSSALYTLIERKHNLRLKTDNRMNIYVKEIDLSTNYKTIIKKFEDIPISSADVIICNFAIHYLTNNITNINNIILLVSKLLNENGRFIFTCFNGNKVFNLLKEKDEWNITEKDELKYSIKKLYKTDKFEKVGQKIGVLLPFSDKQYYDEYLVNLNYIFTLCEKHGLSLEISNSFNTLLDRFKDNNKLIYNKLNNNDKEFIGLYQYTILKKTKQYIPNNLTKILNITKDNKEIEGAVEKNQILPISYLNDHTKNSTNILFVIPIRETEQFDQESKLQKIINKINQLMENFDIKYKIIVIEQTYKSIFKKTTLFNIGFELGKNMKSIVFIDLKTTLITDIEKNINYYIKLCDNPILLNKNYIINLNQFLLINGFSNNNNNKIINRLHYYKINLITDNISIILNKDITYNEDFKDNGLNSLIFNIIEVIDTNYIRYIIDI